MKPMLQIIPLLLPFATIHTSHYFRKKCGSRWNLVVNTASHLSNTSDGTVMIGPGGENDAMKLNRFFAILCAKLSRSSTPAVPI